jgi:hypothetical protein
MNKVELHLLEKSRYVARPGKLLKDFPDCAIVVLEYRISFYQNFDIESVHNEITNLVIGKLEGKWSRRNPHGWQEQREMGYNIRQTFLFEREEDAMMFKILTSVLPYVQ